MTPFLFAGAAFLSTLAGGACALRFRDRLHLLMGFAAGVLLGVVSFDVFPEIIGQVRAYGYDSRNIMLAFVAGFLLFHILEKLLAIHHANEEQYAEHKHLHVGVLSALALAGHSFMDGVGIGLGFQVSRAVGMVVALAVIAHDFTDGMNSVTVMLSHKSKPRETLPFLALDAAAPLLGIASTRLFTPSPHFLVQYLGFFAGFLLYIGASDILPEAHSQKSSPLTILMTLVGVAFAFLASLTL